MLAACATDGLLAAGPAGASCCCPAGATRPACSTSRCGSPAPPRSARCTSTTGCATRRDDDERHCAELCERLGVALEVRRPRAAASAGTSRRGRATSATARPRELASERGADVAAGHTATDQVETILYRLASSPSRRALLGMRPRDGRLVRPLLGFTREDTAAYCAGARAGLARGREQRVGRVRAQPRPRRARAGAARDPPGAPSATCSRWPSSSATRPTCSTRSSTTCSAAGATDRSRAAGAAGGAAPAGRPAAGRRGRRRARAGRGAAGRGGRGAERPRHRDARPRVRPAGGGRVRRAAVRAARRGRVGGGARVESCCRSPGTWRSGHARSAARLAAPAREAGVLDRAALGVSQLLVRPWRPGDRMAPLGLGGTKSAPGPVHRAAGARGAGECAWRSSSQAARSRGSRAWRRPSASRSRRPLREAVRLSCRT